MTLAEIKAQAMLLSDSERATLASHLLNSLPPLLDDDGDSEAMRRDSEMDDDPLTCLTLEEFKRAVGR